MGSTIRAPARISGARRPQDRARRAFAARERARDGSALLSLGGLAGEVQRVRERLREGGRRACAADARVRVGTTRERIGVPVVRPGTDEQVIEPAAADA